MSMASLPLSWKLWPNYAEGDNDNFARFSDLFRCLKICDLLSEDRCSRIRAVYVAD